MKIRLIILFSICILFTSCFEEDTYTNSKKGNFEALWKIMDQKYCFFSYKNINWDSVYNQYSVRVSEQMTNDALFILLKEMLDEVQDGHVNLNAAHDWARYSKWWSDYPDNFDAKIQRNYIGVDYGMAAGLKYKLLDDNIGYIHYASFSSGLGTGNLSEVIYRFSACDGIILDVRNNGGGQLTNSEKLAAPFFNTKTLVGYIQHKTGNGHDDFSNPYPKYVEPADIRYQKTVVVLTNRSCYSAANDFVNAMRYAPNIIIIGDKTGGGSGLPFSSELPNGWSVRFSSSPMLDADKKHIEYGIDPDIRVDMTDEDIAKGIDTIIEAARKIIKSR